MLPQDPMILLSYLNTKLRDFYPTLDALCDDLQIDGGRGQPAAGRHRLPVQPGAESICLLLSARTGVAEASAAPDFFRLKGMTFRSLCAILESNPQKRRI